LKKFSYLYRQGIETYGSIFSWLSWLAVLLVVTYEDVVTQHGGQNRKEAKLIFVSFLWFGLIDLIKCFQRTNVKEKGGEQELIATKVARITKESGRGLNKGCGDDTEQCQVERVRQQGDETIPNNAVKPREQELERGEEIPEKLTYSTTEFQ